MKQNAKNDHTSVKVDRLPPCDFCSAKQMRETAHYDGKTQMGPWANMCGQHFVQYGIGLGLGRGQQLILKGAKK